MAENSNISWTDHTLNPWIGCTKVSPGCKFCYAETLMDHRYGKVKWGPQGRRVRTSTSLWRKPLQWNKASFYECGNCGFRGIINAGPCPKCFEVEQFNPTRQRVFSASLADIFEDKPDQRAEMDLWRADLFKMIEETPNLDWLLLTKRIENVEAMVPERWMFGFPKNVWLGISAENQKEFDERIPLLETIGRVHHPSQIFVSAEPLLGPIDMSDWLYEDDLGDEDKSLWTRPIDWVIVGGESGSHARPMHPDWARSLREQCLAADVAFHFKQHGEWAPQPDGPLSDSELSEVLAAKQTFGRISKHHYVFEDGQTVYRAGKHASGNSLDGHTWSEFPK